MFFGYYLPEGAAPHPHSRSRPNQRWLCPPLPWLVAIGSICLIPFPVAPDLVPKLAMPPVSYKSLSTVSPPAPNLLLPLLGIFLNPGSVPNQLIFAAPARGFSSTLGKAAIGNGTRMRAWRWNRAFLLNNSTQGRTNKDRNLKQICHVNGLPKNINQQITHSSWGQENLEIAFAL